MLLLLVLGMLEVLVVLKDLVVFVGGVFERVKSPPKIGGNYRIHKEKRCRNKNLKTHKTKSKVHLYFTVLHSIIPLKKNNLNLERLIGRSYQLAYS